MAWPTKAELEARRVKQQEAAVPVADKPAEASGEFSLADIARLIQSQNDTIEKLKQRVDEMSDRTPSVQPGYKPDDPAANRKAALTALAKGDQVDGVLAQIPIDRAGQPAGGKPKFRVGDGVQLKRNVHHDGFPRAGDPFPAKYERDAKGQQRITHDWRIWAEVFKAEVAAGQIPEDGGGAFPRDVLWGDILTLRKSEGKGEVRRNDHKSVTGMWKYHCHIKGIDSDWGSGYYDYELEQAG